MTSCVFFFFFLVYSDLSSLEKLFFLFFFPLFPRGKVGILNAIYCLEIWRCAHPIFERGGESLFESSGGRTMFMFSV
jgi:hypothetical protein